MATPDNIGGPQPVYLESQTFVRRSMYSATLMLLSAAFLTNVPTASMSMSAKLPTVYNSTPQPGLDVLRTSSTLLVENPVIVRSQNKQASTWLLMSQGIQPNFFSIPIAQMSMTARAPTVGTGGAAPNIWPNPPTYIENPPTVLRSRWIERQWLVMQQLTIGPVINVPTAAMNMTAFVPTVGEGQLWIWLGSDDGWWPEVEQVWKLNPGYSFMLLAAPTTPPPVQINIQALSMSMAAFPPNAFGSGAGVIVDLTSIPVPSMSMAALAPTTIQVNNTTLQIPVAQMTMTAFAPGYGAITPAPLSMNMTAYPPTVINTSPPTIWDATFRCVNASLIIGQDQWVTNPTIPYGYVISQSPPSGTVVPLWTTVNFVVSFGPGATVQTLTVPSVVGMEAYQAEQMCSAAGMDINPRSYSYSATVPPDYVVAQSVFAGITVNVGTPISMTVSLGPTPTTPTVTVP